jgi:hypothetical protein
LVQAVPILSQRAIAETCSQAARHPTPPRFEFREQNLLGLLERHPVPHHHDHHQDDDQERKFDLQTAFDNACVLRLHVHRRQILKFRRAG